MSDENTIFKRTPQCLKEIIWLERYGDEEKMLTCGLYLTKKIRDMSEARNEWERKIDNDPNNIELVKDYIKCEKSTYRMLATQSNKTEMHKEIETAFLTRIKMLYIYAIKLFSVPPDLLTAYFRFCDKAFIDTDKLELTRILCADYDKPETWINVAKSYAYRKENISDATQTFFSALKQHPTSEDLYVEAIKLQLSFLEMNETDLKERLRILNVIQEIIHLSCAHITNGEFFVNLLSVLEENDATIMTQSSIVDLLKHACANVETIWHVLAQRQLNDLYAAYDDLTHEERIKFQENGGMASGWGKRNSKTRLEACFSKYERGIEMIDLDRRIFLWKLYIDFLFQAQAQVNICVTYITKKLMEVLKIASAEYCLDETHYVLWLQLPKLDDKTALSILREGTLRHPESVILWRKYLIKLTIFSKASEVMNIFKEGIDNLKEKALPLWEIIIDYYCLEEHDEKIRALYEDGANQPEAISDVIKPKYLEWVLFNKGISEARTLYLRLSKVPPYCKELHKIMINFETATECNIIFLGKAYNLFSEQFGKTDADIWLDFIQFYLNQRENIPNYQQRILKLCGQARNILVATEVERFNAKYDELMNQIGENQEDT